jgi:hypothetical protein
MRQPFYGFPESGDSGQAELWTPRLYQAGLVLTQTIQAYYTKLGSVIYYQGHIVAKSAGGSGNPIFISLPTTIPRYDTGGAGETVMGHGMALRVGVAYFTVLLMAPSLASTTPAASGDDWCRLRAAQVAPTATGLGDDTTFPIVSGHEFSFAGTYFLVPRQRQQAS